MSRSSLEWDAIEGESPVGEDRRGEPDEYRPLAEGGKMGALTPKSK